MDKLPTKEEIKGAKLKTRWDLGNNVLYNLCMYNYYHNNDDEILAKVWLIGRAYAVAIERRKNKKESNEKLYKKVISIIQNSHIDKHLRKLKKFRQPNVSNIKEILEAHKYLTDLLSRVTKDNKRSFSSKYLHFHLPNLFFIYDTRSVSSLRKFVHRIPKEMKSLLDLKVDEEYAKFFSKCFELKNKIEKQYRMKITPRQLDNLFLYVNKKS